MRTKIYILTLLAFVQLLSPLDAQTLKLEDAIALGLKNNFGIQVERNNETIAKNSNTLGNAGMLPKVDINGSVNLATNNTKQEFSSGLIVDKNGVQSNATAAGVYLTWTLFDGLKMFATHNKLAELEAMGQLNTRIAIENLIQQITNSYYDVVRQKQVILGSKENKAISEERLKVISRKKEIGTASGLEEYVAQIDLNAQNSGLLKQEQGLLELKYQLNTLLGQKPDTEIDVQDSIPMLANLEVEQLRSRLEATNTSLQLFKRREAVAKQQLRETTALYYPKLNFNANYVFSRSENQAGFALLNQNLGFNYGFTASWTIFNGFNTATQSKNLRLQIQNAELEYKESKLQTDMQLLSLFRKYLLSQQLLKLEEDNMQLVKKTLAIALERFRLGTISALELKELQRSMEDAQVRLTDSRYQTKVAETAILKLSGQLVK